MFVKEGKKEAEIENKNCFVMHFLLPHALLELSEAPVFHKWNFFAVSSHTLSLFTCIFHICFRFCIRNKLFRFYDLLDMLRHLTREITKSWETAAEQRQVKKKLKEIISWRPILFLSRDPFSCHFTLHYHFFQFIYSEKESSCAYSCNIMKLKFFPLLLKAFEKWLIRSWCYWVWEPFLLLFTLSMRINI